MAEQAETGGSRSALPLSPPHLSVRVHVRSWLVEGKKPDMHQQQKARVVLGNVADDANIVCEVFCNKRNDDQICSKFCL